MTKVFLCDLFYRQGVWLVFKVGFTFRGGARLSVLPVEEETAGLQAGACGGRLIFQTELTQLSQLLETRGDRGKDVEHRRRISSNVQTENKAGFIPAGWWSEGHSCLAGSGT